MENFIVTTTRKPDPAMKIFAEEISSKLDGRLVERADNSFDKLKNFWRLEVQTWKILS